MKPDRRELPRIERRFSADLTQANGEIIPVTALNLSRAGMQLGCDRETAENVVGKAHKVGEGQPRETRVSFTLPFTDTTSKPVEAVAQLVYCRRGTDGGHRIGLKFKRFSGDSYEHLEQFVFASMSYG